jgi:hypothetical protein
MRQSVLLAMALSCLVAGGKATADFYDGKMLLQDCQGGGVPQEAQDLAGLSQWGTCVGYIAAVLDTMSNASLTAGSINPQKLCVPENVQLSQLRDTVQLWLRNHPEKRDLAASFLVFQALKEKFPCN